MAHSSSDTAFLTVEKSFNFRGNREHWANAYHLDSVPNSTATWEALAQLVAGYEASFLPAAVQFEKFYGHTPGTPPILVFEEDVPPVGEGGTQGGWTPPTTAHEAPGDAAMWVRWSTTQKNSLGKPIYLRNYYHCVYSEGSADTVAAGQHLGMQNLGQAFTVGINANGTTFRRAGPRGAVAQSYVAGTWITTRTLKARGRRHRLPQTPSGYRWILTNVPESIN